MARFEDTNISVLDKGYVRLVDSMGDDRSVVNAARVSYDRESHELNEKDEALLRFLVRENHSAPFRHAILTLEVYAPLFVARQWWKHVIGGVQDEGNGDPYTAWNESSRRYVTENEEFYIPSEWRGKPANNKQGSAGNLERLSSSDWKHTLGQTPDWSNLEHLSNYWTDLMHMQAVEGLRLYKQAMDAGIAPEQARLFLPANALYVRWRWTSSLQGVMHFIKLRDEAHAQYEIQEYARAVKQLSATVFPACIGGLND